MSVATVAGTPTALRPTAQDRAAATLRTAILDGELRPGQRVNQEAWAERAHVSLIPIREALRADGTYLMLEMNASGEVEENRNSLGKLLYNVSTLYCMTTSLAHGGAGIGACMGEERARELAYAAGFKHFRKLPIEEPFSVLYELKA